jgi:hypothetical protein
MLEFEIIIQSVKNAYVLRLSMHVYDLKHFIIALCATRPDAILQGSKR